MNYLWRDLVQVLSSAPSLYKFTEAINRQIIVFTLSLKVFYLNLGAKYDKIRVLVL